MRLGPLLLLSFAFATPALSQSKNSTVPEAVSVETTEYEFSEIFLSSTAQNSADVSAAAEEIARRLHAGEPWAKYAREFAENTSCARLSCWRRTELISQELEAVLRGMQVGTIAGPIAVSGGYSIIALAGKR